MDRIRRAFDGLVAATAPARTIHGALGEPALESSPRWTSVPPTGMPWSPAPIEIDPNRSESVARVRPGDGPGMGTDVDQHGRIIGTLGSEQTIYGPPIPGELRFRPGGRDSAGNPLTEITTRSGASLRVANPYVERFAGFINELAARGYFIRRADTGGYVNRTTSSGRRSEHARGYAGDFNWQANPESRRRFGSERTCRATSMT